MHIKPVKYRQLLTAARELFWEYGVQRVTVEEICDTAHASKGTFYKYFDNKSDLLKAMINHMIDDSLAEYNEIMNRDIPYREKVELLIQMKMKVSDGMSPQFFADYLKGSDPDLFGMIQQRTGEFFRIIMEDHIKAQKKGEIRRDIRPGFVPYFLNRLIEMARDENLLKMYDSPQELIMELTNFFFYGVLPRNAEPPEKPGGNEKK